jgi:hypothetical protein
MTTARKMTLSIIVPIAITLTDNLSSITFIVMILIIMVLGIMIIILMTFNITELIIRVTVMPLSIMPLIKMKLKHNVANQSIMILRRMSLTTLMFSRMPFGPLQLDIMTLNRMLLI